MNILLVGCGNMGSALLNGWSEAHRITVVDPHKGYKSINDISGMEFDVIVLAVKPQQIDQIILDYKRCSKNTLIISIAIGKSFSYFLKKLGPVAVVRSMPNLSVCCKNGLIVNCSGEFVSEEQKQIAHSLMSHVGYVLEVSDENLISTAAAISGGGPAYLFLFVKYLIEIAVQDGFSRKDSAALALYTLLGTSSLAQEAMRNQDWKKIPEEFCQRVSSPGGSTLRALNVFQTKRLDLMCREAVYAAKERCLELENL